MYPSNAPTKERTADSDTFIQLLHKRANDNGSCLYITQSSLSIKSKLALDIVPRDERRSNILR